MNADSSNFVAVPCWFVSCARESSVLVHLVWNIFLWISINNISVWQSACSLLKLVKWGVDPFPDSGADESMKRVFFIYYFQHKTQAAWSRKLIYYISQAGNFKMEKAWTQQREKNQCDFSCATSFSARCAWRVPVSISFSHTKHKKKKRSKMSGRRIWKIQLNRATSEYMASFLTQNKI